MSIESDFRDKVEAYLEDTKMTPTRFGLAVLNDPGFVFELRKGRRLFADTIEKVTAWMEKHPEGLPKSAA